MSQVLVICKRFLIFFVLSSPSLLTNFKHVTLIKLSYCCCIFYCQMISTTPQICVSARAGCNNPAQFYCINIAFSLVEPQISYSSVIGRAPVWQQGWMCLLVPPLHLQMALLSMRAITLLLECTFCSVSGQHTSWKHVPVLIKNWKLCRGEVIRGEGGWEFV